MRKKHFLALFLINILLFVFVTPASASTLEESVFSDLPDNHINRDAILYMQENGIVQGYNDRTFKPNNQINRAEFVKIALKGMPDFDEADLASCITAEFKDLNKGEWYVPYICLAKKKNIIQGYPDGTFKPGDPIKFTEAAKIVANSMELDPETKAESWESWFKPSVQALAEHFAIPVSIDVFNKQIARSEMAEMVYRLRIGEAGLDSRTYLSLENNFQVALGGFPKIASCSELRGRVKQTLEETNYPGFFVKEGFTMAEPGEEVGQPEAEALMPAAESQDMTKMTEESLSGLGGADLGEDAGAGTGDENVEYSTTNVQVKGVDEADIVKNDDKYIYTITQGEVKIIKAYPPTELAEVATVFLDEGAFTPSEMYVDGNKMVIVGSYYKDFEEMNTAYRYMDIVPSPYYWDERTKAYVIDITDRTNPVIARSVEFEGTYQSSRKVDSSLYLVLNKYPSWVLQEDARLKTPGTELLPGYIDSNVDVSGEPLEEPLCGCEDVSYFPGFTTPNYLIVAALDLNDLTKEVEKEVYLGSAENIYASRENLYVASTHYDDRLDDMRGFVGPWTAPEETTNIYRFSLAPGDVSYAGQGKVPGTILNQFSMDENNGYFRIATTKNNWSSEEGSTNNLYVLNNADMQITGKLVDLAPGEKIYSVRFMGDRAYMVTFRSIDPFYVIDVSNPANPNVLGYLKIPGYSDYLHPFDENHIIGFGKETATITEDFGFEDVFMPLMPSFIREVATGMKIAMFDVTDVANPVEMHKIAIGERGTDSELLWNHKALLFDKAKGIMAFPIQIAKINKEGLSESEIASAWGDTIFSGAQVYDVSLENGFVLRGEATHYTAADYNNGVLTTDWLRDIKRILYIGKYFYTVSEAMIKAHQMEDVKDVNSLELTFG